MINIENLNFAYSRKEHLFHDFSLETNQGSIVGLLGKNGAGKSTLLKLFGGLLKPQSGLLEILNHKPFSRKPAYLEQIYFVPEEISVPPITIETYIKVTSPFYPSFDKQKMNTLIAEFELDSSKNLDKLSYGQKKKFLIAFALATNCKLLLLDEPTNGLDIPSKSLFRKVMAGALSDEQLVLISTHQVKDVENLIDHIFLVDNGKLIFNNSILSITDSISFHSVTSVDDTECLYKEAAPGGYRIIKEKNGAETPLDIELLFNAITNGTKIEIHESKL